ncbi:hypothetical protein OS42_01720 [Dickeya oryzae]
MTSLALFSDLDAMAGAAVTSKAALSSNGVIRDIRYSSMIDDGYDGAAITGCVKVRPRVHTAMCVK